MPRKKWHAVVSQQLEPLAEAPFTAASIVCLSFGSRQTHCVRLTVGQLLHLAKTQI